MKTGRTLKTAIALLLLASLGSMLLVSAGCGGSDTGGADGQPVELGLDTVVLTIGDSPVTWPEFLYWLKFSGGYYEAVNNLEGITDWTAEVNGVPLSQFITSSAVDYAGRHRALELQAEKMGIVVTSVQRQEMAATRAENVAAYGSETEYQRIIRQTYVSESVYDYLLEIGYLSQQVFTSLYGENAEKCSDADVAAYVAAKGLLCARYVFLSNTGTGTAPLSAEEKAKNRELLDSLIAQLDASDDPPAMFADLVTRYGQDADATPYTDGVVFTAGQMPAEFVSAFGQLAENQRSGIVETEGGLYLIMRVPLRPGMIADASGHTLRYLAAYEYLFEKQVNLWYADLKVEFTKAYESIDLKKIFAPSAAATTSTT